MKRTFCTTTGIALGFVVVVSCGARSSLLAPENQLESARDGAADGDADAAPLPCVPGKFVLQKATPAVMFVLDRSTSMRESLGATRQSRWEVLTNALATALPAVDSTMQIGALFYPTPGAPRDSCPVAKAPDLALAFGNVPALVDRMASSRPAGATPTADALEAAARSVLSFRAATSARALVLATDGAPNCNSTLNPRTCRCVTAGQNCTPTRCLDDERTVARIADYAARGLPTYVIGLQGSNDTSFDDVLDAMALGGGRPQIGTAHRYYAAGSEDELTRALVAIRDQVGACTVLSTSVPSTQGTITVTLDGVEIPYDESGASGWMWGNKPNGEIVLLREYCSRVTGAPNASLIANVTCDESADASVSRDAATDVSDPRDAANDG